MIYFQNMELTPWVFFSISSRRLKAKCLNVSIFRKKRKKILKEAHLAKNWMLKGNGLSKIPYRKFRKSIRMSAKFVNESWTNQNLKVKLSRYMLIKCICGWAIISLMDSICRCDCWLDVVVYLFVCFPYLFFLCLLSLSSFCLHFLLQ